MIDLSRTIDALLGREGSRITREQLADFYRNTYVKQNPTLDAADVPRKAVQIYEVCRASGISSAESVLEVGCGSGFLLDDMGRKLGARTVVGVDYSPSIAAIANGQVKHHVVASDGLQLPFAADTFDVAYFADVLEHVLEPIGFLREVARVSRTTAFLIPLEAGLLSNVIYALRRARQKPTNFEQYGHIWRWIRPEVTRLIRAAGLELHKFELFHGESHPEGLNAKGRVIDGLRVQLARTVPELAEAIFGGVAFVGVATRRMRSSSPTA